MSIQLTTPWAPWPLGGPIPPETTYPEAKILKITWSDSKELFVMLQFGHTDQGEWVPGAEGPQKLRFEIRDSDFETLASTLTNDGEGIYAAMKRIVYGYLQSAEPNLAGTID